MYYQYTDINAVKSIIETNSIRLTNVKYLNDKAEFHIGLNFLSQAFYSNYIFPNHVSLNCINSIRENFILWNNGISNIHYLIDHLYVASFSYAPDVLSQWRGYGMYAIEFNQSMLTNRPNLLPLSFLQCTYTYNEEEAKKYALNAISYIVNYVFENWVENGDNSPLMRTMQEMIAVYALTFKYPAFREEQEVRLIFMNYYNDTEIDFRVKNNLLVPYVTVAIQPKDITGVIIGPIENQQLSYSSLDMLCKKAMFKNKSIGKAPAEWNINLRWSEIPFTAN